MSRLKPFKYSWTEENNKEKIKHKIRTSLKKCESSMQQEGRIFFDNCLHLKINEGKEKKNTQSEMNAIPQGSIFALVSKRIGMVIAKDQNKAKKLDGILTAPFIFINIYDCAINDSIDNSV